MGYAVGALGKRGPILVVRILLCKISLKNVRNPNRKPLIKPLYNKNESPSIVKLL